MCLGIPGLIVQRLAPVDELDFSLVEFAGLRRRVCTACVSDAQPGDYVIVHAGIAISRIDTDEATRLLQHLREIGGDEDWVGRTPTGTDRTDEIP
jgi:hydrogenase expression/formation protein HypC